MGPDLKVFIHTQNVSVFILLKYSNVYIFDEKKSSLTEGPINEKQ